MCINVQKILVNQTTIFNYLDQRGHIGSLLRRHVGIFRDGTRHFSGIPENQKSPGFMEKEKKFWNLEDIKKLYNSNDHKYSVYNQGN